MKELRILLYQIGFQFNLGDSIYSSYTYPSYTYPLLEDFKYRITFCEGNREELDLMGVSEEDIIFNKNMCFIMNITVEDLIEYLKEEFKHELRKKKINKII